MGRQNKDPAVAGSSIVLLQERFKQLQRLKEMREERQLLKLLPQSTDGYDEPAKLSMSFSTSEAAFQDPLALGLNSNAHHMAHFRAIKPQQFPSAARGPRSFFEKPDVVDTSLRL
ncbi:hypothetical protein Pfo_014392 [Paulownia fortunei]|nr:hypothetical protein Pfo_014392 [Paulownia fortunei]